MILFLLRVNFDFVRGSLHRHVFVTVRESDGEENLRRLRKTIQQQKWPVKASEKVSPGGSKEKSYRSRATQSAWNRVAASLRHQ